jgi:hypothetical protein
MIPPDRGIDGGEARRADLREMNASQVKRQLATWEFAIELRRFRI